MRLLFLDEGQLIAVEAHRGGRGFSSGEDLATGFSDKKGVLELRASLAIYSD